MDQSYAFSRVVDRAVPGSQLVAARPLEGGMSAHVTALDVVLPGGGNRTWVVRRHGPVDLAQNPDVAEDEYRLLGVTTAAGLLTPAPIYLDETREVFPTPYLVLEHLAGETVFSPENPVDCAVQMAEQLVDIHGITCKSHDLTYLRDQAAVNIKDIGTKPTCLDNAIGEAAIRRLLVSIWPPPGGNEPTLVHGDYWPGNILWQDGRLVGIIDWEDAQFGEPLADVASCRLELLWMFGEESMRCFTQAYERSSQLDLRNLPYWDLCVSLRYAFKIPDFAEDAADEMRLYSGHRWFVRQATDTLGH